MTTTVGIKMLKENLSAYVAMAVAGERVIITDRGREVAELGPLTPERRALQALMASGTVRWRGGKPRLDPIPLAVDADLAGAVAEDRR